MLLLKFLVKFVKLLNSETSSLALALAFSLGMFIGLMPLLTPQAMAAILVILFFRVNVFAALCTFGAFKLLGVAAAPLFDRMGASLLEAESLVGLHTWLYNSPLSFCGLNHSITLGATLTAGALFIPALFGLRFLIDLYRARFNEWWSHLGIVNAVRASSLYRLYTWIDSPFEG